jgi:hypothetical protein
MQTVKRETVTKKPTADMPLGIYRVVDANGIYWGTFRVCENWCRERFVMEWIE